jgi:hypothetical protein
MAALATVLLIFFAVNMIVGLAAFEWAWYKMRPVREIKEERDSKYPAFRRWDVPKWEKWKFYPGAVLLMPIKLITSLLAIILCYVFIRIITLGHNFNKNKPIKGWLRNLIIGYIYKLLTSILVYVVGIRSSLEFVDVDYS